MTTNRPVAVLGGGSFGTALANLLASNKQQVLLWMRDEQQAQFMREQRKNPRYLKDVALLDGIEPVTDLIAVLEACELVFVALPSTALRAVLEPHAQLLEQRALISTTKG